MARPATTTRAILLRSVAYGEADRIVTLLTDAHGKVALMARGARRSQRRFAGSLEPFAVIEAEVALGAGEVGRLGGARVLQAFGRAIDECQCRPEPGQSLTEQLLAAVVDPYQRKNKTSRNHPRKKYESPPKPPRLANATPEQRQLARSLMPQTTPKGLTA